MEGVTQDIETHDIEALRGRVDPITLEIIRHGLISIPNEIDANITRTAHSPLVYEYKDYACGMVDPDGRLIAQGGGSIPIFVANALGNAVQDGLLVYGRDGIEPGDVIISNHGGTLGQHLNNVVMYTPVFVGPEPQDLAGFMCVLVHWVDIGGKLVGSCSANDSTEIFQEGIQFRSIKIWSRGEPIKEIYRIVEYNTRFPAMVLGDLEAQLAGCMLGRDKFAAMIERYGLATVRDSIELIWHQSEMAARAAVRALPDGTYTASSFLDHDGVDLDKTIPIEVSVIIAGDELTVDLSGVADQLRGPLNSGFHGGAVPAARIAFKYTTTPEEPANDGTFRPLNIVIPDGKFLSAGENAPLALYSAPLPTVIDTIIRAIGQADPNCATAGHHASFCAHHIFGTNPKNGELYHQLDTGLGGWGARDGKDGPGPYKTMAHGDTLDVPAEVQEAHYPLYIESVAFRTDSAGDGEYRGGLGTEKIVTMLAPAELAATIDRAGCLPWGLNGGSDGEPARGIIEKRDAAPEVFYKGQVAFAPGDRFRLETGGGGGFGPPHKRAVGAVAEDVAAGYVSRDKAFLVYGVVVDEDGAVDSEATAHRRAKLETA